MEANWDGLETKLAPDPALILWVVVFVVIGCVEMRYFFIFSTIIQDYNSPGSFPRLRI